MIHLYRIWINLIRRRHIKEMERAHLLCLPCFIHPVCVKLLLILKFPDWTTTEPTSEQMRKCAKRHMLFLLFPLLCSCCPHPPECNSIWDAHHSGCHITDVTVPSKCTGSRETAFIQATVIIPIPLPRPVPNLSNLRCVWKRSCAVDCWHAAMQFS